MLSLVAYESSDEASDNEETIENEEITKKEPEVAENGKDEISVSSLLPAPKNQSLEIVEEEDDEFLHKKATPLPVPKNVKKGPVKITIPSLSDFKEEDKKGDQKIPTVQPNKGSSLLSMLPRPKTGPASTVTKLPESSKSSITSTSTAPSTSKKSVPMIPYSLMNKKKQTTQKKKPQKQEDSDSDEEAGSSSFFSFAGDEKLPEVSQNEINSMVAKKAAKMNEFIKKLDKEDEEVQEDQQELEPQPISNIDDSDRTAFNALMGESKAKRTKLNEIQFVELSAQEVLPDRNEWLQKTLRGETQFLATGNIEKGPNALAKRKHQISYLSMRAETNEAELEAMWASNRQTKRESKSKYGF